MDFGNKIPQEDILRPVTHELIDEIEGRFQRGWRTQSDLMILINFARKCLNETR